MYPINKEITPQELKNFCDSLKIDDRKLERPAAAALLGITKSPLLRLFTLDKLPAAIQQTVKLFSMLRSSDPDQFLKFLIKAEKDVKKPAKK